MHQHGWARKLARPKPPRPRSEAELIHFPCPSQDKHRGSAPPSFLGSKLMEQLPPGVPELDGYSNFCNVSHPTFPVTTTAPLQLPNLCHVDSSNQKEGPHLQSNALHKVMTTVHQSRESTDYTTHPQRPRSEVLQITRISKEIPRPAAGKLETTLKTTSKT